MTSHPEDLPEHDWFHVHERGVNRDEEVVQSERRLFRVVDEVDVSLNLAVHIRNVGVANVVRGSANVEDLGLVNKLAGSLRVLVLIGDGLGHSQLVVAPVELNLSALVHQVVVVLSLVKVEITRCRAEVELRLHRWVHQQIYWVVYRFKQRHPTLLEVKEWDDASFTDPDALFVLSDGHGLHRGLASNGLT